MQIVQIQSMYMYVGKIRIFDFFIMKPPTYKIDVMKGSYSSLLIL